MMQRISYSLFMFLALAVFLAVRHFVPRPAELRRAPWQTRAVLGLAAFIGGALGSKVPFVLGLGDGTLAPLAWLSDGKTITTGLIGAYLGVELAKWWLDVRVKTGDTFALPLACALCVGRWGCFFNGCCHGTETTAPWGCDFGDGVVRHPTQAYESLFHLLMAFVLLYLLCRRRLRTHQLQFYLICYGVYRFLSEFIRPEPAEWAGLTFYQWTSIVLVAGMTAQWIFTSRAPAVQQSLPQPRRAQYD
jgi:prolipoprotein diacylglyceryltransferase